MAFKYGVVDYILKPLNETKLFEVIEKIRNEIGRRKNETAEINRMKVFIEEKVPLLHEKFIFDLDNVFNSMKSYNWKETEEYIRIYYDNCIKDRDILEFPYIAVFELLTVLKRLQALNGVFPSFDLSLQEICDLKKIRNFVGMREAAIQVFRKYFGIMVEQKSVNRNLVENVKEYVKNHCTDIINISDISSLFFISPAYLSRLFRRVCGVTFSGYLLQCRMEKAKELLIGTDAKIYEISSSAGFGSEKYFIRSFKKHFNISPMKFREETLKVNK
jgi:two-component system response regulator YesN